MTESVRPAATRRTLLIGAAIAGGLPLAVGPRQARAAGTLPKTAAKYQDHPNGANKCDNCVYWLAGPKPSAEGTCKVVAGPVAPNAWCILFAPKPR
jgi:hypothetical protein